MMVDIPDSEAIELLSEYSSIVRKIARSACFSSSSIDFNDLCQVGDIAVLHAVKTYDPTLGMSIKSYVGRIVRQEIYNEAGRFLGVFTVDHRVTSLSAKITKLYNGGKTEEEIAAIMNKKYGRPFDIEHIRDLRIAYERRQHAELEHDNLLEEETQGQTIADIVEQVVVSEQDKLILEQRLLGDASMRDVAKALGINIGQAYKLENLLKNRLRRAITDITE